MPGAYNVPFAAYAGQGETFAPLEFPDARPARELAGNIAYNLDFDARSMTLTSLFKGRGLGDCGTYHVWSFNQAGGATPITLREQRKKEDCDGNVDDGVETWELVGPRP